MASNTIMGMAEAIEGRAEMLGHARTMAVIAGDERRRWGDRYEAVIIGDHCLDIAKDYDAFIRGIAAKGRHDTR